MTWRLPIGAAVLGVLAACAAPGDQSPSLESLAPSEAPRGQVGAATAAPSATVMPSVGASAQPAAAIAMDELVRTTVGNLTVRAEPSTASERLGVLPVEMAAFTVAGPVQADEYTWYRLASPGHFAAEVCTVEPRPFHCGPWIGWAAGLTPTGDRWIERFEPDCAPGRDTTTYLSMDSLTRLACAGDDEWRLVTYLARAGGRGCFPAWLVDPNWMDQSCSLFFPQPIESEFDSDTRIQGFIPPELGQFDEFDELKGSWVEVVGHLDDPIAQTCTAVRNEMMNPVDPVPLPQPDPELVILMCRLNLMVTEVSATAPPNS